MTAATQTILAGAEQVGRRFGAIVAVDGVDVSVGPGEVVGLVGANGAGKTTLVRLLLGLIAPTTGRVELFGAPPSRAGRARIGYVPQGLGLYEDLTVAENLAFVARVYGSGPAADPGLDRGGARVDPRATVADLPLGRRRRAAFATALVHHPDLLVLDEPTSGVDPLGRARLWDTVHDVADAGAGVLVTTHYMSEAEQCDRLVVMAAGKVVAAGTPEAIIAGRHSVRLRSGAWGEAFQALDRAALDVTLAGTELRVPGGDEDRVREVLGAAGITAEIETVAASLDEAFVLLSLVGAQN